MNESLNAMAEDGKVRFCGSHNGQSELLVKIEPIAILALSRTHASIGLTEPKGERLK